LELRADIPDSIKNDLNDWTFDKSKACQKRWNCMTIGSCGQPISAVPRRSLPELRQI
jgi:hypothetical protein